MKTVMTTEHKWKLIIGFDNIKELNKSKKLYEIAPDMLEACKLALSVLATENIVGKARLALETVIKQAEEEQK